VAEGPEVQREVETADGIEEHITPLLCEVSLVEDGVCMCLSLSLSLCVCVCGISAKRRYIYVCVCIYI
jgi:hypothetical protein